MPSPITSPIHSNTYIHRTFYLRGACLLLSDLSHWDSLEGRRSRVSLSVIGCGVSFDLSVFFVIELSSI